ncbi:hypothetical protein F0562_013048 [Nyssa sinensis]|uniref:Pentacotripeptide-repeat region of PRORP domain-containing protein n=1 Tax=Nyssa sinensis TaxID=561372 RepID=A0A5J4ZZR6_9ASTE|nr:hypothetical protein F0562_013048 [Nyssa sinensis]
MEASVGPPSHPILPEPNTEKIKQKLIKKGVYPTPKIVHTLRKKELQKSLRKSKRRLANQTQPLTESQKQAIAEEAHFQTVKTEFRNFTKAIKAKTKDNNGVSMIGKPWERLEAVGLRELASSSKEYGGDKLKPEHLRELSEILEKERDQFRWLLDDDIELEEGWLEKKGQDWTPPKRQGGEAEAIRFLVDKFVIHPSSIPVLIIYLYLFLRIIGVGIGRCRLSGTDLSMRDWKFSRMMKQSGLQFTEGQLLKIVEGLGDKRQWRHAVSVVEWVFNLKEHRHYRSRFVYTKLLAVLGKGRRPHEALQIFNLMRGDSQIYPDMAAYHSIAVTLGQAGLLKELINIIECMRQNPSKSIKNMRHRNWDPALQPDVVVFNAVLNACVPSHQWRGVSWVFEQFRKSGLKPNGATYGLAMEVMLQSGKYDHVHDFFRKMRRSGEAPKAVTYKGSVVLFFTVKDIDFLMAYTYFISNFSVLVRSFWEEGKVNEAVKAVRDMEQRGIVGAACVYYELACCLCNNGRWQEAMMEVEKLKKLPHTRPLEVTFTGMIMSSMDGGHVHDCISIFEHIKEHFSLDIGIINAMLKVYGRNDMFSKAKELFEETKGAISGSNTCLNVCGSPVIPDVHTFSTMLEASGSALQWEYFEYVYKEMALSGCQLDQNKQASLLVEASRAGKWYLLEHAFDAMLEAGEIPHLSFFTELVCQAIALHDYEKVVTLVNTMAHAPFQVSEKQWTDLLEKNGDRINIDSLKELLEVLCNWDLAREATVSNLLRSLEYLCGSDNLRVISSSVAFGNAVVDESHSDGNNGRLDCNERIAKQNFPANVLNPCKDLQGNGKTIDIFSVGQTSDGREDDTDSEMMSGFLNYDGNRDEKASEFTNLEDLVNDLTSDQFADCVDDRFLNYIEDGNLDDVNEVELDLPTSKVGDSQGSLPSAYEILDTWKKSRNKDGNYFSFYLAGK